MIINYCIVFGGKNWCLNISGKKFIVFTNYRNTAKRIVNYLKNNNIPYVLIGKELTRGLGCGGKPSKGREAAKEAMSEIKRAVSNADMVFVIAGMGGGTGTGASPEIAKLAKEVNAIIVDSRGYTYVLVSRDLRRIKTDKEGSR